MSSLQNRVVTSLAKFAGVSSAFDKKIESGVDRVSAKFKKTYRNVKITETSHSEHSVYVLESLKKGNKNHILYFHGGAYLTNFSLFHIRFLLDIVKKTGCSITTPDYPLSPQFYYKDVFDMIFPLYKQCIEKYGAENLIVMGDSAGGGLALAISQLAKKERVATPQQIILISPWLDLTCSDPYIEKLEKKDPMLQKKSLIKAGQIYGRGEDLKNHLLSPINGVLKDIGDITLFTGTYDLLNADARRLQKKAIAENVKIKYIETPKMIHIWPIIGITPEAGRAREEIFSILTKNI